MSALLCWLDNRNKRIFSRIQENHSTAIIHFLKETVLHTSNLHSDAKVFRWPAVRLYKSRQNSVTLQKLIIALRARWVVIWTTEAIMSWLLNIKPPAAINFSSPPLPFAFSPQGYHSVTSQYSACGTVGTIRRSTITIVAWSPLTKKPNKYQENKDVSFICKCHSNTDHRLKTKFKTETKR